MTFVGSQASRRLWQTFREAGRPLPAFSDDDVVDYMVMEAVMVGVAQDEADREDAKKRENFRKSHRDFKPGQVKG